MTTATPRKRKTTPSKARKAKTPKSPARGQKIRRYTLVDWYDISPEQWERMSVDERIAHRNRGQILKVEEEWVRRALEAARPKRRPWPTEPDPAELYKIINALFLTLPAHDARPPTAARIKRQFADIRDAAQALADKLTCIEFDRWEVHASALNDVVSAVFYGYRQVNPLIPQFLVVETQYKLADIINCIDILRKFDWPQATDIPWVGPNERVGEMLFIGSASFGFGHVTGTRSFVSSPTSPLIRFLSSLAEPLGFETSPDRLIKKLENLRQRYKNGRAGYAVKLPFGHKIILSNLGKRS